MSLVRTWQGGVTAGRRRWAVRLPLPAGGDLRLVWSAQAVSQLGDGIFTIGIVWLMVQLTGSGLALSGTLVAQLLPYAILGAAAGALADRWNRRVTMVVSDVIRGLVVALIPLLDLLGVLHVWMVPAVAFLLTSAAQFFDPSKSALVPAITPEGELVRVNALLSGTRQVLFIAGPAVGGALVAGAGTMAVFWVDALSFFLSAAILMRMRTSGHARRPESRAAVDSSRPRPRLLNEIRDGFHYVWRVPVLRLTLIFGTIVNFLLSPLPVLIPLFLVRVLGLDAAGFGSLLSVIFAGFLIGVTFVGVRGHRLPIGLLIVGAMAVAGAAAAVFGAGPPLPVILLAGLAGGAAVGAMEVGETTLLQRESADELRGRVFALYESVSQGGRALAVVLAGVLFEGIGLRLAFYGVGAITVACALALLASPSVRRVR